MFSQNFVWGITLISYTLGVLGGYFLARNIYKK